MPFKKKSLKKKKEEAKRTIASHKNKSMTDEFTTSLHFLMVSRFPRLSSAFRALAAKLREDMVSDRLEILGQMVTIINVFALPPEKQKRTIKLQPILEIL